MAQLLYIDLLEIHREFARTESFSIDFHQSIGADNLLEIRQ